MATMNGAIQCARLLEALRRAPVTSIEAREAFGLLHPAGRVCDLRKRGYAIDTLWRTDLDAQGRKHRVAVYVLKVAS